MAITLFPRSSYVSVVEIWGRTAPATRSVPRKVETDSSSRQGVRQRRQYIEAISSPTAPEISEGLRHTSASIGRFYLLIDRYGRLGNRREADLDYECRLGHPPQPWIFGRRSPCFHFPMLQRTPAKRRRPNDSDSLTQGVSLLLNSEELPRGFSRGRSHLSRRFPEAICDCL